MLRSQKGDKEAMMTIIDRFAPLIRKQKNSAPHELRQDLEQTLFETLIRKMKTYDVGDDP